MVGGLLGAGKTTAMLRLGEHLVARGVRVGLVTNDQSSGLADTTLLSASGFPVEEITGGCFCCRFTSLTEAAERLTARVMPDVFLAEPVGSCTDLKATVSYPLRRMYGDNFSIAPFSVLLDPVRALRVLGLEEGRRFSDKVLYVYGKQLEEADVLVINKIDTVALARLAVLRTALRERCPSAVLFEISAKTGAGNAIDQLKMTLTPADHDRDLCVVNAVSADAPPVSPFRLQDVIDAGELIINLRAEGDPEVLRREAIGALTAQAANAGLALTVEHIEHFRPGRPVPTHRVVMA